MAVISKAFPPEKELVIDLGGVTLSWLLAWLLWWMAPLIGGVPTPAIVFLLALYLFLRLNFLLYAVRDTLVNGLLRDRRLLGDITIFAERLSGMIEVSRWTVYALCMLLGLIDAAFLSGCVRQLVAIWAGWAA